MDPRPDLVEVGRVGAANGLHGWVRVQSYCDPPEQIVTYLPLRIGGVTHETFDWKRSGKALTLKLPGVDDREAAQTLTGSVIEIDRTQLPEPEPGAFYHVDLVGLEVRNGHDALGRVDRVMTTGANDVLVVRMDSGQEILIPFAMDTYVRRVDLEAGILDVDWNPDWL